MKVESPAPIPFVTSSWHFQILVGTLGFSALTLASPFRGGMIVWFSSCLSAMLIFVERKEKQTRTNAGPAFVLVCFSSILKPGKTDKFIIYIVIFGGSTK